MKIHYLGEAFIREIKGILFRFYLVNLKFLPHKICVSIIIPAYNASKYISACIDSMLCQTLRNIEIIRINDSSSANGLERLMGYQQKDSRIIVINQENLVQYCINFEVISSWYLCQEKPKEGGNAVALLTDDNTVLAQRAGAY